NKYMDNAFAGLKIVVVGLILAAAIMLIDKNNFIDWKSVVIFIISVILVLKWKVNPILLTVIAGIAGIIIY
ncbi:chromate transporter, partial [Leptotrichia hongkongensis]